MCIAAVGIGLSLLGSGLNFAQQSAYTSSYNDYQRRISERNKELAFQSAKSQYGAIGDKVIEASIKYGSDEQKVSTDALAAEGRVHAAAAEAGVTGNSLDALLNDFERQRGEFIGATEQNKKFLEAQAEREKIGVRLGYESRLINSVPNQLPQPNLFGEALSAFSGAFNQGIQLDQQAGQYGHQTLFL